MMGGDGTIRKTTGLFRHAHVVCHTATPLLYNGNRQSLDEHTSCLFLGLGPPFELHFYSLNIPHFDVLVNPLSPCNSRKNGIFGGVAN